MTQHTLKIACLSGKGGAGKTFVSVNLAVAAAAAAGTATYIDCDVEEPNGRLFLKPQDIQPREVCSLLPRFDAESCTGCRECVRFCRFHALVYIKDKPLLLPEMCHSCGGCSMVCPAEAVSEAPKRIGTVETGVRGIGECGIVRAVTGVLDAGEASGMPVIKAALDQAEGTTIIDCPPGSACSVMESAMDADYCILVAEPTAFGFHNFKMVHELAHLFGRKCGVIINKQDAPFEPLEAYCAENNLEILARIPYDANTAAEIADGHIASESSEQMRHLFRSILKRIGEAAGENATDAENQGVTA